MTTAMKALSQPKTWTWQYQGKSLKVCYETWGKAGRPLLMLPALSTVSSRHELGAIARFLTQSLNQDQPAPQRYQPIILDWPGFGDSDRPRLDYQPALYQQLLQDFVRSQFGQPVAVMVAGHGAGYVMATAAAGLWSRIVLVAPTWRGPLAVMGAPKGLRKGVKNLVRTPLLGQALYGLNTQPGFLKWMYQRHVFVEAATLTDDLLAQRHASTQQPGARYAPGAFVTGGLDPAQSREEFLGYFTGLDLPILLLLAQQAPPSSKAEMEAMAQQVSSSSTAQVRWLPGTLGMAEEFSEAVAQAIIPFLADRNSPPN